MFLNRFKRFEKQIEESFIGPKNIPSKFRKAAYYNMISYPLNLKKIQNINQNGIYVSSTETSGKISDAKAKSNNKGDQKEYIFGQHKNTSFYEVYSRELIFQLFEYPIMSYYKYNLFLNKSKHYYKIIKKFDDINQENNINNKIYEIIDMKKDKKNLKTEGQINNESLFSNLDKNNKVIYTKKHNIKNNSDDSTKIHQEINILKDNRKVSNLPFKEANEEESKIGMIKPEIKIEEYSNVKGNKKAELIKETFENKSDIFNSILNNNKKDGLIGEEENKIIEGKDEKELHNELENKQDQKAKIKERSENGIISQSISDETCHKKSKQIKKTKKTKKRNQKRKELSKSSENLNHSKLKKEIIFKDRGYSQGNIIKIIPKEKIEGDFDFLIHSLKGEVLERVLSHQEISPCAFYGNFTIEVNQRYDIIGEIKESSGDHEKLLEQASKYIKLINNLEENIKLNNQIGFKINNKKIMLYVLNGYYQRFIEDILDYKINQKKFKEMENYKNKKSYIQIIDISDTIKENSPKNQLMNLIIKSGIPFIFIFIQNLTKFQEIKTGSLNQKLERLEKEIKELKKSRSNGNEYNNINNKEDQKQNINKDSKYYELKINELTKSNEDLQKKYEDIQKKLDKILNKLGINKQDPKKEI